MSESSQGLAGTLPAAAYTRVAKPRFCPACGRGPVVLVSEIVTHDPEVPSRDTWECRDCLHTWETAVAG